MQLRTKNQIIRIIYILFGSFVYSMAINALYIPHQLLSGGATGIAMMLEYLFSIPVSISLAALNVPLFLGGYRSLGKRFVFLSIIAVLPATFFICA
jgi:uncharacterized membrane-anchored protein YitT (DUF2179 family)